MTQENEAMEFTTTKQVRHTRLQSSVKFIFTNSNKTIIEAI
jgi:hypothetical protein